MDEIKLRYTWWWFISDKCPECIELAGMIKGGGLKSLFVNRSKLGDILMQNGFDIANLEFINNGWAYIDRTVSVEAQIRNLTKQLSRKFNVNTYKIYEETKNLKKDGIQYFIDRMFFVDPAVAPYMSMSFGVKYIPAVISPFARSYLEEGINPQTPIEELEKLLFGGEYKLIYHTRKRLRTEPIWTYMFERKMKLPFTRPKPF